MNYSCMSAQRPTECLIEIIIIKEYLVLTNLFQEHLCSISSFMILYINDKMENMASILALAVYPY